MRESFDIYAEPIVIGEQAWLATDVFVAPGVEIGAGTVVGARSSVFKFLPGGGDRDGVASTRGARAAAAGAGGCLA